MTAALSERGYIFGDRPDAREAASAARSRAISSNEAPETPWRAIAPV